jgi:hypothetical protein
MQSFTQEDLLQYLYQETSDEKTVAIRAAMETDWDLKEKFEVISSAQKRLEKLILQPRKKAVDFVLRYAEKSISELSPEA